MYTSFLGTCRCFRCKADSEAYIPTYLFKTDAHNASQIWYSAPSWVRYKNRCLYFLRMTVIGTKRTCRSSRLMSVVGGRTDSITDGLDLG
jgi:hypothetical protein